MKKSLNCRGRLLEFSTPKVMGIINLTSDSFYANSRATNARNAVKHAESMLGDGAAIIDLGAQSTRPGASFVDRDEEWQRMKEPLAAIRKEFPGAIISIDTFYAAVAEQAIGLGADMINDVSAGSLDPAMHSVVARAQVPYVLMHMQGTPETMQEKPEYENVVEEVLTFLVSKLHQLKEAGIYDVVIDPGFGFGKSPEHNYRLLKNLSVFKITESLIMVGLSRKSMVNKVLHCTPQDALNGTTVLHTIALLQGADLIRVHDVKEAIECIQLVEKFKHT